MTYKQFEIIMGTDYEEKSTGAETTAGIDIMRKYTPNQEIVSNFSGIYFSSVEDLIENGITEEDVKQLNILGWFEQEDGLYHFT